MILLQQLTRQILTLIKQAIKSKILCAIKDFKRILMLCIAQAKAGIVDKNE